MFVVILSLVMSEDVHTILCNNPWSCRGQTGTDCVCMHQCMGILILLYIITVYLSDYSSICYTSTIMVNLLAHSYRCDTSPAAFLFKLNGACTHTVCMSAAKITTNRYQNTVLSLFWFQQKNCCCGHSMFAASNRLI